MAAFAGTNSPLWWNEHAIEQFPHPLQAGISNVIISPRTDTW
jgi:hypothetical protein